MIGRRQIGRAVLPGLLLALLATAATPCDTPVYRYALYKWTPSPYRLHFLHRGEPAGDHAAVHKALRKLTAGDPAVNLQFVAHDLAQLDAEPTEENAEVFALAKTYADQAPCYVLLDPHGREVYAGPLTARDVASLARSPLRDRAYAELAAGKAGVIVLLLSTDAAANQRAEQEIERIIQAAAAGEIAGPKLPEDGERLGRPADAAANENEKENAPVDQPAAKPVDNKVQITLLKLNRDDPAEAWLVRSLLSVEDDLAEIDEPMAFALFGRGRVTLPRVGDGIVAEQLREMVSFLLGACVCEIKHQNPGGDVLMAYDWGPAATAMAKRFGPEIGNEHLVGGEGFPNLFPQIIDAPPLATKSLPTPPNPPAAAPSNDQPLAAATSAPALPATTPAPTTPYRTLLWAITTIIATLTVGTLILARSKATR